MQDPKITSVNLSNRSFQLSCWSLHNFGSSHCGCDFMTMLGVLTSDAEQLQGYNQLLESDLSEVVPFNRPKCSSVLSRLI